MTDVQFEMRNFKPNPAFVKDVTKTARKKWHDALITCPHEQGTGKMISGNQHKKAYCCLMVGHETFGGTDDQRGSLYPHCTSPFTKAMKGGDNPYIALKDGDSVSASQANDLYELSFAQIAQLVYPEKYTKKQKKK